MCVPCVFDIRGSNAHSEFRLFSVLEKGVGADLINSLPLSCVYTEQVPGRTTNSGYSAVPKSPRGVYGTLP